VLIGNVTDLVLRESAPLVYYQRAMHWRLCSPTGQDTV
jgi:hypothetical protein